MTRKTVEFCATTERPYMIIIRRKKEPVLIYMTCRKKGVTCSLKLSTTSMLFALDTNSHKYIRFNFKIDESALLQTFFFFFGHYF